MNLSASSAPPTPFWKSRVVVDAISHTGLTAHGAAVDDDGVDAFARGVDGGRQTGGAAADDGEIVGLAVGLDLEP